MKVGILTWFFAYNYGARAHSYALQKILEKKGYDGELIDYRPANNFKIQLRSTINFENPLLHPIMVSKGAEKIINFEKDLKIYKRSQRVKEASLIDSMNYDVIIVGSDEILNYVHPLHDPIYFGVGLIKTKHFFYAPSCGQANVSVLNDEKRRNALKDFCAFSARDRHTKELLDMNTGCNAKIVLDPTLLYDFTDIKDLNWNENNYILVYSFENLENYKEAISTYAKIHQLKIVCIGSDSSFADISYPSATFETWIEAFRHASLVVTDSFHGTVFAIKNKVRFVICSRPDKINKIKDLFEILDIEIPFYDNKLSFDEYLEKVTFDYEKVHLKIQEQAIESIKFITETLDKINE